MLDTAEEEGATAAGCDMRKLASADSRLRIDEVAADARDLSSDAMLGGCD